MPYRCALVAEPELSNLGVRQLSHGNYRVLFSIDEARGVVHIHHVRHGARNDVRGEDFD